jgi:Family of unknown function (DUF5335)
LKGKKMATEEIPREDWSNFFNSFSQGHEGWLATLEVFDNEVGAQEEARELPFEGISLDSKNGESQAVVISIGRTADHVTHTVHQPKHVWLQRTAAGADASLEIEAEGDSKTLLRFLSPVPSEFVDDVVP